MIWAMAALVVILMALIAWGDIKLMLGFVALVAVAGISLIAYDYWADERAEAMIGLSEVAIEKLQMTPLAGGVYELTGRVENLAREHHLRKVAIRVSAQDCATEAGADCVTIGEITPWLHTDVPAGQARDIKEKIRFREGRPKARGELRWAYEVVSTQGG